MTDDVAALDARAAELAALVVADHYARVPELETRYGPAGRAHCVSDATRHIGYLARSLSSREPAIWLEYLRWGKSLLAGLNIATTDLEENLISLRTVLARELGEAGAPAVEAVDRGLAELPNMRTEIEPYVQPSAPFGDVAVAYVEALIQGRRGDAMKLIHDEVAKGTELRDLYLHVFQPSQYEVGRRWQINQLSVAQEHYCTAATQLIISSLYVHLFSGEPRDRCIVATCVSGDMHELGVRMVADFFEMDGWQSVYLGANTPVRGVVEMVEEHRPDVVALSVTIADHLPALRELILALRASPAGRDAIIIVGGYPFRMTPSLYVEYGADGAASDAQAAVVLVEDLFARRDP